MQLDYEQSGVVGPTGPIGPTGPAGGPTGPTGPAGATGPQGITGVTGPAGPSGSEGATGPSGMQGVAGVPGATGARGPLGRLGPKGDTGSTGPTGPAGPSGASGGPTGPVGPTGPAGPSANLSAVAGVALSAGQPVYVSQVDALVYQAGATLEASSQPCGFCLADTALGQVSDVVPAGRLELTDWSVPLGGTNLLAPGAVYFLSGTAGQITASPPTTGFLVQIGIAVTTTALDVDIKTRVRL